MKTETTIPATPFVNALRKLAPFAGHRDNLPVLDSVFIQCEGGLTTLAATDMETHASVTIEGATGDNFALAVPAAKLLAVIDLTDDLHIKISVDDRSATFTRGPLAIEMGAYPSGDFPMTDWKRTDAEVTFPGPSFRAALLRVRSAISTEETRYYLNGAYLHGVDGFAVLAATDGHRLVEERLPDVVWPEVRGRIIPRRAISRIIGLLEQHPYDVRVEFSNDTEKVRILIGDVAMVAKSIDGTYPEYRRFIPKEDAFVGALNLQAVELRRTAEMMGATGKRSIPMILSLGAHCSASVRIDEIHKVSVPLVGDWSGPEGFKVAFQCRYLSDLLNGVEEEVTFRVAGANDAPTVVKSVATPGWTGVLMPMKI